METNSIAKVRLAGEFFNSGAGNKANKPRFVNLLSICFLVIFLHGCVTTPPVQPPLPYTADKFYSEGLSELERPSDTHFVSLLNTHKEKYPEIEKKLIEHYKKKQEKICRHYIEGRQPYRALHHYFNMTAIDPAYRRKAGAFAAHMTKIFAENNQTAYAKALKIQTGKPADADFAPIKIS